MYGSTTIPFAVCPELCWAPINPISYRLQTLTHSDPLPPTITALVYQQEVMCEFLSVEEHLLFQGTARMSDRYAPQEIAKRVDQVCNVCVCVLIDA